MRTWLEREPQIPYKQQWREAVSEHATSFKNDGQALAIRPLKLPGLTAHEVVKGFVELSKHIEAGFSLRQLSARCFHGHSKLLDAREDLLNDLFWQINIKPRPILVNLYLPELLQGILFIENYDSYIMACESDSKEIRNLALVYISGFQGSAKRIREKTGVSLHYQCRSAMLQNIACQNIAFENTWFDDKPCLMPMYFWGDLDYSGMAILKVLRQRFGEVQAWQTGYAVMLDHLLSGEGHKAKLAHKEDQLDPDTTGCTYTDDVLLPAIRENQRFVDQEFVLTF